MNPNEPFRIEFRLETDPDGGSATDPDEAASWGYFRIECGDRNICWHADDNHSADRVHWYLLGLLEWLVGNWDALLHEVRLPRPKAGQGWGEHHSNEQLRSSAREVYSSISVFDLPDAEQEEVEHWWRRHALRAAANGGIFPDLFIRRLRDSIELSWGNVRHAGIPNSLRFVASGGRSFHAVGEFAEELYRAVESVASELQAKSPNSERIATLVRACQALKSQAQDNRLSLLAGLRCGLESLRSAFRDATGEIPSSWFHAGMNPLVIERAPVAVALFGSVSPNIEERDLLQLLGMLRSIETVGPSKPLIDHFQQPDDDIAGPPWEQGYRLALYAREELAVTDRDRVEIEEVLAKLGIRCTSLTLHDTEVRAVALCGQDFSPTIAVNENCVNNASEPGRRFTLAHELCHILFDRDQGVPLAVASGPWAPVDLEKRANAFAAMFLMPEGRLRQWFRRNGTTRFPDDNEIQQFTSDFGVGQVAALRHLENLDLIDQF